MAKMAEYLPLDADEPGRDLLDYVPCRGSRRKPTRIICGTYRANRLSCERQFRRRRLGFKMSAESS
jgi:hypothetical protein